MVLVSSIITKIRSRLYESTSATTSTGAKFLQDDEIIEYINDAIDDLCEDTDINYKQFTYNITAGLEASSYTLSELSDSNDIIDLYSILYKLSTGDDTNWYPLYKASYRDLKADSTDTGILTGQIHDSTLFLNRTSVEGEAIFIDGKYKVADIASSGETFPLNFLGQTAVIKYATAMGFYKKEKFDSGDKWMALYFDKKQKIEKIYRKMTSYDSPSTVLTYKNGYEPVKAPQIITP